MRGLKFILDLVAGGQPFERRESKTIDVTDYSHLNLRNANGNVTVEGTEGEKLVLTATKRVRASSKETGQRRLDQIDISVLREKPELTIATDISRLQPRRKWSVDYEIRLPRYMPVSIKEFNGNVVVSKLREKVTVETKNGNVRLFEITGEVDVKTTNGNLKLQDIEGSVDAKTTNGNINLFRIIGPVSAKTTNGNIRGEITDFKKGDGSSLHSVNGNIKLRLPRDTSANLIAATKNGRIGCDIPMTIISQKRNYLEGSMGSGEAKIELGTKNGNIKISAGNEPDKTAHMGNSSWE